MDDFVHFSAELKRKHLESKALAQKAWGSGAI